MKIVVVGDALVSSETLKDAASQLAINEPISVEMFEWHSDLSKEKFQEKILAIETGGPGAVDVPDGLVESLVDADILLVHIAPVSKEMLLAAKKLKVIGTCRGGLEHIDLDIVKSRDISLLHVIRNAEPVADFTIALMYAETRNIARSFYSIKTGGWRKSFSNDAYKTTLANHTVGLIGLGYIGKLVLKRLNALGVPVIAYDPFANFEKIREEGLVVTSMKLEDVFSQADIISLHMRVTPETENMINKELLDLMKPSSYLINTARAAILSEADLIQALTKKQIAGAALDVAWNEPISATDPLLSLDNVTLTTHIAGDTIDAIPRSPYLLKEVMNEYFKTGKSDMLIKL